VAELFLRKSSGCSIIKPSKIVETATSHLAGSGIKKEEEGIEQPSSLKDTLLPCPFDFSNRFGGSGSEKWQSYF
jgi:hypothetical protein